MTQMHQDKLANTLCLVSYVCQSMAEPRYWFMAGEERMLECCGEIVVVLPQLERQWLPWSRLRLQSLMLLWLLRKLGRQRRTRNKPGRSSSGRKCQIMLLSGWCHA